MSQYQTEDLCSGSVCKSSIQIMRLLRFPIWTQDMSTWPYSTKTTANSREQEKTKQNSPRTANATFQCFSTLKKRKGGGGWNQFMFRGNFFNNSKVTKIAVIETNQITRILEIVFRDTVVKITGYKWHISNQHISGQINPTKRFDKKRRSRIISWAPFISR